MELPVDDEQGIGYSFTIINKYILYTHLITIQPSFASFGIVAVGAGVGSN